MIALSDGIITKYIGEIVFELRAIWSAYRPELDISCYAFSDNRHARENYSKLKGSFVLN